MLEALQFDFMRNALIAGVLISFACGIIGTLVVINRLVFISGGIAHAAYGGVGLALFTGISPLVGTGIFSIGAAIVMGALTRINRERADTIIGAVWAAGMATGVILIDLTPGYYGGMMTFLFGSILAVPASDLILMGIIDVVILALVGGLYKEFQALSFDEEFAGLRGVKVVLLYYVLLILTALTILMTIRLVGLILVIALLTIPIYMTEWFSHSLWKMMLGSVFGSLVFVLSGLFLSYRYNITSGAAIVMVASGVFLGFILFRQKLNKRYEG